MCVWPPLYFSLWGGIPRDGAGSHLVTYQHYPVPEPRHHDRDTSREVEVT
jgi:hypothetical protein